MRAAAQARPLLNAVLAEIVEAAPRALLALLDGRRDRAALDAEMGSALGVDEAQARRRRIDEYVRQFARLGLLIG